LKNKQAILLLLIANSISGVSQGISMLAIPWYFTNVIHQSNFFSFLYLFINGISLIWGLYAGTLVDRHSRKNIFLVMNIVGLVMLSGISITGFLQGDSHWSLVALAFATTVFIYNIHFPNLYAFAQEITPKEQYAKVTSQLEIQGQVTWTIAGGVAALLLNGVDGKMNLLGYEMAVPIHFKAWKIHEIFMIDAATYFVAFMMIYFITTFSVVNKEIDTDSLVKRMRTGFSFLKRNPILFLFGNASLIVFLSILIHGTLINPIYVDQFLHQSGDVYAMSDMVFSAGALLAGFIATSLVSPKNQIKGIALFSVAAGLLFTFQITNRSLPLFFLSYFIIGACNASIRIHRITYLFSHIPNHIIGRANSVFFMVNVLERMLLISLFTLPFFHHHENIIWANGVLAFICILAGLIIYFYKEKLAQISVSK